MTLLILILLMGLFNRKSKKTALTEIVSKVLPTLIKPDKEQKPHSAFNLEIRITFRELNG